MVEVGKAFDEVEPEDGQYITDTDAAFDIRLRTECIGGGEAIGQREFHLGRIVYRIVLIAQPPEKDLGGDDLSPFQPLEAGDLVEEKAIEEMVDIDAGIVVGHKLPDIHKVVGSTLGIEIGLVADGDD